MKSQIDNYLQNLKEVWLPVKEQAIKYLDYESHIALDNSIQIFRRPWVAPFNYGIILYPPAQHEHFDIFERTTGRRIPDLYQDILLQINGCFVYDFTLFGLTPSLYSKKLINRSYLQPLDLGAANTDWIKEYKIPKPLFHIGGRAYSDEENVGYFLNSDNKILSIKKNGNEVAQWASFLDFLKDEISAGEKIMLEEKGR